MMNPVAPGGSSYYVKRGGPDNGPQNENDPSASPTPSPSPGPNNNSDNTNNDQPPVGGMNPRTQFEVTQGLKDKSCKHGGGNAGNDGNTGNTGGPDNTGGTDNPSDPTNGDPSNGADNPASNGPDNTGNPDNNGNTDNNGDPANGNGTPGPGNSKVLLAQTGNTNNNPSDNPPVSGDVGGWISQAQQILAANGVPMDKMNSKDLATIIQHESSGDPNAINLTDSNAQAGHPSIGLMQTIQPTFDDNKLPGHDNIRNPVDNIIAAVRYAVKTYGSLSNVPGVVQLNNGGQYVGY